MVVRRSCSSDRSISPISACGRTPSPGGAIWILSAFVPDLAIIFGLLSLGLVFITRRFLRWAFTLQGLAGGDDLNQDQTPRPWSYIPKRRPRASA
jgi:hypothetical protein